jgi:F-type H+-transporting ATPase subunit delta
VRDPSIARNYAEALFALGEQHDESALYVDLMDALVFAIETEPSIRVAIESPQVPRNTKVAVLERALDQYAPERFVRFLAAVVKRGRQYLLATIDQQFRELVDEKMGRVRAGVTLAREPDEALREAVRRKLSEVTGKEVIPQFRADPAILGGLILRMRDRIIDGSLRRRMLRLKRQLLSS